MCQYNDDCNPHDDYDPYTDDDLYESLVCGCQVQVDKSGAGYCWVNVDSDDLPAHIREEIECEMVDGGWKECDSYRASNGLYYRW